MKKKKKYYILENSVRASIIVSSTFTIICFIKWLFTSNVNLLVMTLVSILVLCTLMFVLYLIYDKGQ